MSSTPKKVIPGSCFLCPRKRYYRLGNRTELISKLSDIVNVNFEDYLASNDRTFGICRPCVELVNSAHELVQKLKLIVNCDKNNNTIVQEERFKRLATSPLTPKVKPNTANPFKRHVKSVCERSLSLSVPKADRCEASSVVTPLPDTDHSYAFIRISERSDHEYSKSVSNLEDDQYPKQSENQVTLTELQESLSRLTYRESNQVISEIVSSIVSNQALLKAVQAAMLKEIDIACATLASRNVVFGSILAQHRSVESLVNHGDKLLQEVIHEMSTRVPFLLDLFTVIATSREVTESKTAPIAAAYAILLHARSEKLSAWHRITTLVAIKGQLDESGLTRLNHMGVALSATSKLRLLDEAGEQRSNGIVTKLAVNPLVKLTVDNLDIYVRTGHQSSERSNRDLHMFASNIIFSRVAKPGLYSNIYEPYPLNRLSPEMFLPTEEVCKVLRNSYHVILGRILVEMKAFSWLHLLLPAHIYHPYQQQMSHKSDWFQLPVIMKNEAKHEDCIDILDEYETVLCDIYKQAFGSEELLHKYRVPVGGDQLTRVRLEEAKNLRSLATTPRKRLEDLQPLVIELWLLKQDLLEKCYKELYSMKTLRQPGTLYHYKAKLQRTDINGKVKGAFKAHHEFLLLLGKQLIQEQFLEYFGMADKSSEYKKNVPSLSRTKSERPEMMFDMLDSFICHYGYLDSTHETDDIESQDTDDTVYNYCCNTCHWVLLLLMLEDVVREGDIVRVVPCLMYCAQFFFSHSRLSKYFVECLDFILKSEYLLSPLQKIRVLEGAFTNLRGHAGNNIESDLLQENSVRNQKELIRSLGANKSEKAILRSCRAADAISQICENIDSSTAVKKASSRHQTPKSLKDEEIVSRSLRELRPFQKTQGRLCQGMPNILRSPLKKINNTDLKYRIVQVITRLYYGQNNGTADEESEDEY